MRFEFTNLSRLKKTAKLLLQYTSSSNLSNCQQALSKSLGYRDWHELAVIVSRTKSSNLPTIAANEQFSTIIANLVLSISKIINITPEDIIYALAVSRLFENFLSSQQAQLDLQIEIFRKTSIPFTGRRQSGEVGKLKSPGRNNEKVILQSFGRPTSIVSNHSLNGIVADYEYISPNTLIPLFIPERLFLPYGEWAETESTSVIFSRDYCPLWRLHSNKAPERLYPWERVNWISQSYFWEGANVPFEDSQMVTNELERISSFGIIGLPRLVHLLPIMLTNNGITFQQGLTLLKTSAQGIVP